MKDYGNEFDILVQPRVEGALPMEYVHTDLALLVSPTVAPPHDRNMQDGIELRKPKVFETLASTAL